MLGHGDQKRIQTAPRTAVMWRSRYQRRYSRVPARRGIQGTMNTVRQAGESELPVHPAGHLKLGARISSCQSNGRQRTFNICQCASLPFSSGDIWGWLEHSAGVLSEDHDPACRTSHKCCTRASTWTPQHQTPTRFPINLLSASPPEASNQPPQVHLPCCLVTST